MIRLLGDRVLVKVDEVKTVTETGIMIPEASQDKPQTGIVKAVGEGRYAGDGRLVPMRIHEGDKVLFERFAGTPIEVGDEKLMLMLERDVIAVLGDDAA